MLGSANIDAAQGPNGALQLTLAQCASLCAGAQWGSQCRAISYATNQCWLKTSGVGSVTANAAWCHYIRPNPIDCGGSFSACTAACEPAAARVWTLATAPSIDGSPCPNATSCVPGAGQCACGLFPRSSLPPNALLHQCAGSVALGATCDLACANGFAPSGTQPQCTTSGQWLPGTFGCQSSTAQTPRVASPPPPPSHDDDDDDDWSGWDIWWLLVLLALLAWCAIVALVGSGPCQPLREVCGIKKRPVSVP
jgi:hypothetical protein